MSNLKSKNLEVINSEVIPNLTIDQLATVEVDYGITQNALKELEISLATVPDCSTAKGYKKCNDEKIEIVRLRNSVKNRTADVKRILTAKNKDIQAGSDDIINTLLPFENARKEALAIIDNAKQKEKEKKEAELKAKHDKMKNFILEIEGLAHIDFNSTTQDIENQLSAVNSVEIIPELFESSEDLKVHASSAKISTISILENALAQSLKREEQKKKDDIASAKLKEEKEALEKEKAKIAKEKADFEAEKERAKEEEDRKAKIVSDKIAAEKKKIQDEKDRIENDRIAKEEEEKQKALKKQVEESKKAAKEEIEKREKEAQIANKEKRISNAKEMNSIILEIVTGVSHPESQSISKSITLALLNNKIPHVEYIG